MNVTKIMAASCHSAAERHTFSDSLRGQPLASKKWLSAKSERAVGIRLANRESRTRRQASSRMGPIKKAKEVAMERANAPPGL